MDPTTKRPPIHHGRVLKRELEEAGVTANVAALALRIPANRLTAIINGGAPFPPALPCDWGSTSEHPLKCG